MGVWIIIILLVIGSLILGPIGFFLAMRLFDRVERLESSNDLQSKTLNHLKELCQSLQGKLDELEKLARLQQLSQQAVPDLTATATENQTSDFSPQASGFASDTNPGSQSPRSETLFLKSEARSLKPQSESVVEIVPEISQEPAQPVASFLETVKPIAPIVDAPVDALQQPSGRQPPIETVLPAVKHKIAADLRVAEPTVTPPHVFVQQSQGGLPHSERQRGRSECDRLPVKPAKKTVEADSTSSQWLSLELLIGRKVLPWVASGLFLLFAVFLIQYAFEKGWITEVYKVIGMGLLSAIFLGVGKYFAVKRLRYFATALTSAGISIAFLAGYATYGFYNLLPPQYATVLMTAVVVGSFLLSRYYVSRLLGIVSIIAGLAVPLLLGSETDLYNEFFSYLILLNIGTVVLINVMKRPPIAVLAFVGTQIEFWLWYRGNYMPDKIRSVILFQAAFYFVYLIDTSLATLRPKQRATWDDAMRAIISPALFYGTCWFLLQRTAPGWTDQWLGVITFAFSAWYAILAVIYARRLSRIWDRKTNDELKLYWTGGPAAATVMSLAFLALAIPMQFEASAIMVGWITIGSALWCFGNLLGNRTFVIMSVIFLLLGVGRMIGFDLFQYDETSFMLILRRDETLLMPLLNSYALPVFSAGLVLCAAGCFGWHILMRTSDFRLQTSGFASDTNPAVRSLTPDLKLQFNYVLGYFGLIVATAMLSVETFEYFRLRPEDFEIPWPGCSVCALTVLWTLVGLLLMTIALACKAPTIRVASMIALGIVTCKLLVVDLLGRMQFHHELEPIRNTVTIALAGASLALIALPTILRFCDRIPSREINLTATIFRLGGVIALFVLASTECYYYFEKYPLDIESLYRFYEASDDPIKVEHFFARASLSVFWGLIALVTFAIGMITKKRPARIAAIAILALTGIKIASDELFVRPGYILAYANPYFLTILVPSLIAMLVGVWATRLQPLASENERTAFTATGVCGLLFLIVSSSFECWHYFTFGLEIVAAVPGVGWDSVVFYFQARAALAVFWSIWAIVLFVIGMTRHSQVLRVMTMLLLALTGIFTATTQLFARPDVYEIPLANPYFLTIAFAFATMILLAIWGTRLQRLVSNEERNFLTAIGLGGLALAWGAMTVECYSYFRIHTELNKIYVANTSVTVFWTVLAILIALIAHTARSKVLRYAAVVLLGVTLVKVLPYELWHRPGDFATLFNPFMLAVALLSVSLMTLAIIATRIRPAESPIERHVMFALGLAGLALIWTALSDECFTYFKTGFEPHSLFVANASLTVFWTLLAVSLLLVSQQFHSLGLRVTAIVLLAATFIKAIPLELIQRPGDLEPLLNPYMPVLTLLSMVMIGVGVFALGRSEGKASPIVSTERLTGQVLAFAGLALLFVSSSIECHDSVRSQIGDEKAAWVAQMAISMLWSVFAGILVFVGIVWRSASLRWVAILLFAVTTFKVVINDMAGFDRIYRIGAFFVLALVMMFAAWAYQRFKPESPSEPQS